MTRTPSPQLDLTAQARDALRAGARASRRRERGGILVGYRTQTGLRIEDALLVPDQTAARTHYLRRAKDAARVLNDYLDNDLDPFVGYVGEWHTHPSPVPPSPTDRASMRLMSIRNKSPVALIVAALESNHRDVQIYAMMSAPDPLTHRLLGRHKDAAINLVTN